MKRYNVGSLAGRIDIKNDVEPSVLKMREMEYKIRAPAANERLKIKTSQRALG